MYLLRSGRQVALGGILLASFGRGGTAVPSTTAPRNLYPPADERLRVEDGTNWAGAPSWCEARGGDSEVSRSSHDGRRVTKSVAPVRGQRIRRVAVGGGAHRKFHNLKAAKRTGGGDVNERSWSDGERRRLARLRRPDTAPERGRCSAASKYFGKRGRRVARRDGGARQKGPDDRALSGRSRARQRECRRSGG